MIANGPAEPGPTLAGALATFLLEQATTNLLDPIEDIEVVDAETLRLITRPVSPDVWASWCHLLMVEDHRTTWRGTFVTAHGSWDDIHVVLVGHGIASWVRPTKAVEAGL
ncbi:hypothetical protein [Kitasatospora sp. P5_F3]